MISFIKDIKIVIYHRLHVCFHISYKFQGNYKILSPHKKTLLHVLAISQCTSCHCVYLRGRRHKQLERIQQSRGKYGKYEEKLFFLLLTHTKTNNVSLKHLLNHHLRWFHFLQKEASKYANDTKIFFFPLRRIFIDFELFA